jgi:hypothetical protein
MTKCGVNTMRKLVSIIVVALGTFCSASSSNAQGPVYAPLSLFTTGDGMITPFTDGQMLEVGQDYTMEAVPSLGFAFSSWQPVNIITFTEIFFDGVNPITHTSVLLQPDPVTSEEPVLDFTMQPLNVLVDTGTRTVTEGTGWQANFVPTPEPSTLALMVCGLMQAAFWTARRMSASGSSPCWKSPRSCQPKPPSGFKSSRM